MTQNKVTNGNCQGPAVESVAQLLFPSHIQPGAPHSCWQKASIPGRGCSLPSAFPFWMLNVLCPPVKVKIHEDSGCALRSCSKQGPSLSFACSANIHCTCQTGYKQQRTRQLGCCQHSECSGQQTKPENQSTNKQLTIAGAGREEVCLTVDRVVREGLFSKGNL